MENQNGALGFRATLDIDDFNVSAQAMEKRIQSVSNTTAAESLQMDQSIQNFAQNGARYIVSYLVGQGMSSLLQSIVQTRGQFQQLEIAFGTMLKSETKAAQLMGELVKTAAKTPFDLQGIANSAKQMMAYGSSAETVVSELTMLGNVAAGIGAPLGEIAYLYGTLRTQGRAYAMDIRQFAGRGIPIYEELAKILGVNKDQVAALVSEGKVGFAEVEKVFQNLTSSTGMYYNLMEKQSASLTGMLSNLSDSWDSMLNEIGTQNQDVFGSVISGASYLVEHYKDILRIIKAITIAYGGYKAAVVLQTLVTKGYTGVALLDNTVRNAKIALLKLDAQLTGKAKAQTEAMTAAEVKHTAALQAQLTVEERENLAKKLRIATIQSLLTAQQQEYLSNLNLTTSSTNYEAVALGVLSVEQREALNKTDLSSRSAVYRAALKQEVAAKTQNQASTLALMRAEVSEAHAKMQSAKTGAVLATQAAEQARYELAFAKETGDARAIAIAQKKLEAAQDNASLSRKAALAAQTDFLAKKKALEATASRQSAVASATDTAAKAVQTTTTSVLSAVTTRATAALRAMWAAMIANPLTALLTIFTTVISMLTLFRRDEEETTDAMGEFQEATKKEIDNLEVYFAVLRNAKAGTKTHKDAIEKVNTMCKEYNKTLLDENATLDQQKQKYEELATAIQQSTAEKVKAKYAEQALQQMQEDQDKAFGDLTKAAGKATYYSHSTYNPYTGSQAVYLDSSIQDVTGAAWEMIQAEAIQSANQLKGLTGDAYTEAFNGAMGRITAMVQQSVGASDQEMSAFSSHLQTYLTSVVTAAQQAQAETQKVEIQLQAITGTPEPPTPTAVDYTKMSFAELDKLAKEAQEDIDEINAKDVKVEADTTQLTDLLRKLGQINTAIDTKEGNLNTEKGINERIKQLKEERETVEINGTRYKELSKTISELESRLPKNVNRDDQIDEKRLEAQRKLEEDRISIMEDGYEKRKALLAFQHQQNIDRINKEERELAETQKKAGKGGLTQSQREGFEERRNIENQSFNRETTALFNEEISYRKEQYELYYRWVEAMGVDVANTQFSELLKSGNSYSQWIDQKIAILNQKKAENPEGFSKGDSENLFTLITQRNALDAGKSNMDLFNESVTRSINQAAKLAEKIEAIAKAKEDLANGKFKLSPDEILKAQNSLDQMDEETKRELNEAVLNDFKSYEERKNEIIANYNAMRLSDVAKNNAALLERINQGEANALSALQAEQLQASTDWKNLFTNLDVLTASEIEKLIANIESTMAQGNIKLEPADYQALMDSLNQAKEKVVSLNPFKALGSAFKEYIKNTKDLKNAEANNLTPDQIKAKEKAVKTAAKQMAASIASINGIMGTIGDVGADLASSFGNDELAATFNGVSGALVGAGTAAGGVAKIMSGDLIGGISNCIAGVAQFITSLNGMSDAARESNIEDLQEEIDALADSYDELGDAIDHAYSTAKADLLKQQNENLAAQNEKIRQQIKEERAKKNTDAEKTKEWEKQIEENEKQIEENARFNIIESIMGTDISTAIDDFANAYADAWAKGEKAAGKSADTVKKLIKTAIIEQLKNKLAPEVEAFMGYLAEALSDGVISDAEEAMLDEYKKRVEETADNYGSQVGKWMKDDSEESKDALSGAVRSMSEETGGIVAGRMNAIVINQSEEMVMMRQQLIYQSEIVQNTKASATELAEIRQTLKRMENKDSSLLSQGIS